MLILFQPRPAARRPYQTPRHARPNVIHGSGFHLSYVVPSDDEPIDIVLSGIQRLRQFTPTSGAKVENLSNGLHGISLTVPRNPKTYYALLTILVRVDEWVLLNYELPPLYESEVRYMREPEGSEVWQSNLALYISRGGDCEDLACALVAEALGRGKKAQPVLSSQLLPNGGHLYHVRARIEGQIEDPSRVLGMAPSRAFIA